MYYSTLYSSPIGIMTLACNSDDKKIIGLWIEGQKYHGSTILDEMIEKDNIQVFNDAKNWLDRYFYGKKPAISELPLAPIGSSFRQIVWSILCDIPYGEVITYGEIAKKVAKKLNRKTMSNQAIGGAVGHNPISIIIPCHRVVGADGSLTGYAGGIDTKMKLLELEGINISCFFVPRKGTAL